MNNCDERRWGASTRTELLVLGKASASGAIPHRRLRHAAHLLGFDDDAIRGARHRCRETPYDERDVRRAGIGKAVDEASEDSPKRQLWGLQPLSARSYRVVLAARRVDHLDGARRLADFEDEKAFKGPRGRIHMSERPPASKNVE